MGIWTLQDKNETAVDALLIGHPGADWGSGFSPCGYNKKFDFGICIGYNSMTGMNCTLGAALNQLAIQEATCLMYDTVLGVVGGPRLNHPTVKACDTADLRVA